MEKTEQMAYYEIGWWKAHHRGDRQGLIEEMAHLYQLLFDLTLEVAIPIVIYRVEARASWHIAEKYEDEGNQKEADVYWNKAEGKLREHFALLEKMRKK